MATKECPIKDDIKQVSNLLIQSLTPKALVQGKETDTTHIFRSLKNTERVYKNKTAHKVRELEKEKPGDFSILRPFVSGKLYYDSFYESGNCFLYHY